MIDLKSVIKLASQAHTVPLMRALVFDGRNAIALGNSRDPQPWWAGVPFEQSDLKSPVAVPVDAVTKHFLRSRNLRIAPDHLHNGAGLKTEWDRKTDWSDALSLLPQIPQGEPLTFDLDLDSLDRVLIAVAEGDIRHSLNAVLLDMSTGRIAGCDGARLHLFDRRVPKHQPKKSQGPMHVLIPKAAARWLLFSADKTAKVTVWKLGSEQPLVLMRTSDGLVFTSSVVGKFPDYMRILRSRDSFSRWAKVKPAQFADSVKAMAKLQAVDKPKLQGVAVQWAEGRIYAGAGPEFVKIDCELKASPGAWHQPAEKLFGYFNPRYLEDVADCVTEKAEWCIAGPSNGMEPSDQAMAVFEGDFAALVMPQRDRTPPSDQIAKPGPEKAPKGQKPAAKPPKAVLPAQVPPKAPEKAPKGPKPAGKPPKVVPPAQVPPKAPEKAPEGPKPPPKADPAPQAAQRAKKPAKHRGR